MLNNVRCVAQTLNLCATTHIKLWFDIGAILCLAGICGDLLTACIQLTGELGFSLNMGSLLGQEIRSS